MVNKCDANKIRNLINELNMYTEAYDAGNPIISDREWDVLYFTLVQLEAETGLYYEDSPTQRIYFQEVSKLDKVVHNHLMLSLAKTKEISEVKNFLGDKAYICMGKMDGLTCSLTYRGGKLVGAETRGNGEIGEDILHNALVVKNIPKKILFLCYKKVFKNVIKLQKASGLAPGAFCVHKIWVDANMKPQKMNKYI